MAAQADFQRVNALIAEAIALCESAQDEFERINKEIQQSNRDGHALIATVERKEEQARSSQTTSHRCRALRASASPAARRVILVNGNPLHPVFG